MKIVRLLGPPNSSPSPSSSAAALQQDDDVVAELLDGVEEEEKRREEKDDTTRRRRVKRAESGVKAYELGAEVGRRVAGKLERHRSQRGDGVRLLPRFGGVQEEQPSMTTMEESTTRPPRLRAATPSQLLGSPPSSAFTPPPSSIHFSPALPPLELPSTPALAPLFIPSSDCLPAVHTPFTLDPLDPLDDGYFGSKRRRTRRESLIQPGERRKELAATSSPSKMGSFSLPTMPTTPPTWRSRTVDVLIYLLIGSYTTHVSSSPSRNSFDTSLSTLGGLLGLLVHSFGFAFFLLYHLSTLLYSSCFAVLGAFKWAQYVGRHLTGRTEVSRAVGRYWRTCWGEWSRVCEEEGEGRMGVWGVVRALGTLAVLQRSALLHLSCFRRASFLLLTISRSNRRSDSRTLPLARRPGPAHPSYRLPSLFKSCLFPPHFDSPSPALLPTSHFPPPAP